MRKKLQQWLSSQRSQGLVEFALIAPVILLLTFGIIDFGRGLYFYITLQQPANEAAGGPVPDPDRPPPKVGAGTTPPLHHSRRARRQGSGTRRQERVRPIRTQTKSNLGETGDIGQLGVGRYNVAVDIWLRRCSSFEEEADADRDFWARFSPDDRVGVLEQMRREWLERHGRVDEGRRRVARVLQATRS